LVANAISKNMRNATIAKRQSINKSTPKKDAVPFPPLNCIVIGKLWPIIINTALIYSKSILYSNKMSTCMSSNAAKYKEIIALNTSINATNAPYVIPTCNAVLVAPAFLEPPFLIFICLYLLIICEPFIQPDKEPMSAINIGYNATLSSLVYDILCKIRRYIVFIFIFD